MDQALTPRRPRARVFACASLLAGALGSAAAVRAQIPDPTRPPSELSAPAAGAVTPKAAAGVPQVQSILVSLRPGGRRLAIIDGKTVREGDRLGNAVVATIRSTEVILRRGSTMQVLKLFGPMPRGTNVQP